MAKAMDKEKEVLIFRGSAATSGYEMVNMPANYSADSAGDGSEEELINTDTTDTDDDAEYETLNIDQAIERKAGFGTFQYLMVLVMGWANSADAVEMMSISFILPIASCELKATDFDLGLLTALGFAGMMVGGYFWGTIADIKGRINPLILCQACNALFVIGSAVSQNLWFLMLMRFCSGFGVGGTGTLIYVYVLEFLPADRRGMMTGIMASTFVAGQMMVGGMAWLILPHDEWSWTFHGFTFNAWRIFMLVSSLPVITSLLLFMMFPKSPRYLMLIKKEAEAKAVIKKVYFWNKNTKQYNDNYRIIMEASVNTAGGVRYMLRRMLRNCWQLFSDRKIRPRFLYSSVIAFCLAFSYYGLTMWFPELIDRMESSNATSVCDATAAVSNKSQCDNSNRDSVYSAIFINSASNIPGHLCYFFFITRVKRKTILALSLLVTAVSVFFIWFVSSRVGTIVASCAFTAITIISWDTRSLIVSELFPTEIRATASGVQTALFNRVGAILASIIFGALISTHCAVPILLIAGLLTFAAIVTYKLPDTTNEDMG